VSTRDQPSNHGEAPRTGKPEVDEGAIEKAKKMEDRYRGDRPTVVLPGSGGTVSGTAINDWLDDEGNPIGADRQDDD
jgi:hypothetical protein